MFGPTLFASSVSSQATALHRLPDGAERVCAHAIKP